jgi:hypothetical protein
VKFAKNTALLLLALSFSSSRASAQNPDTMMPEASAAKAKQLLAQMIDATGGVNFLRARESECSGRRSQFGHNNDTTSYIQVKEYWRYPDKYRIEFSKKGNIVDIFNGEEGWTMDHSGVSDEPGEKLLEFQDRLTKNPWNLLRYRLREEGMAYRYVGLDLIDLRPVDWVELVDRQQRTYRIAIQKDNHLMVRFKVITSDNPVDNPSDNNPYNTGPERNEEETSYANYHAMDGIQTPLQIARSRNGRRMFQAFYESCTYSPNLPPDFFTRAALNQRFQEVGSRTDKKKAGKTQERE